MKEGVAISLNAVGKRYRIYRRQFDRFKEIASPSRAKYHEEFWALKDLTFDIPRGSTFGLIGANGAGKSTTLKILAKKLRPTTGTVEVQGRISSILELGTGFQETLTGRENARLNALFCGQDPWKANSKLDAIFEFAGITEYADRALATYSSGMKARLAFAVLTMMEPETLLLDEALATGDAAYAEKCKNYLRSLTETGCTVVVASHDLSFMVDLSDHLVWLEGGVMVDQGDPARVVNAYLEKEHSGGGVGGRPRCALLRFEVAEGDSDLSYAFHCAEWVGPDGEVLSGYFPGDGDTQETLTRIGRQMGLTEAGATAGWSPPKVEAANGSSYRTLTPAAGRGAAAYMGLPFPASSSVRPVKLRIGGKNDLSGALKVSILLEGRYHELGSFGRRGEGAPWYRVDFELPSEEGDQDGPA